MAPARKVDVQLAGCTGRIREGESGWEGGGGGMNSQQGKARSFSLGSRPVPHQDEGLILGMSKCTCQAIIRLCMSSISTGQ